MLNNTTSTRHKYLGGYSSKTENNPFKIDNPYSKGEEDISWLL